MSGTSCNGMPYGHFVLLETIPLAYFVSDKCHISMPNGRCGPQCMQMQRRGLITNRVRDNYGHKRHFHGHQRRDFQRKMHQNPFGTAAGLCPDPLGSLLRSPGPLAGFTGRETPGNGLRREEEKRGKGMEKERWKWRGIEERKCFPYRHFFPTSSPAFRELKLPSENPCRNFAN